MVGRPTAVQSSGNEALFVASDPYQAYPSFPAGAPSRLAEEPAVQLIAVGPFKQRRLTVAFRLILAIPHAFVLFFLDLAGLVIAFLGWWGALFTGRLPEFAMTYLSGLARWNARYYGYLFLLTDDYPPFSFDEDPLYPVAIEIPPAHRLNRFAVFFRLILAVWGNIVWTIVGYGACTIVALIAWLITLVTGKLPAPLHQAYTAVLRFQTRYHCYLLMVTSTYPWKLFGDEPAAAAPAPPVSAWADPPGTAAPYQSSWGTPPAGGTAPGYPAFEFAYGGPAAYSGAQPASRPDGWPNDWRLVLSRSARAVLIVFIVLGLATYVGLQVARFAADYQAHSLNGQNSAISQPDPAVSQWNSAFTTLQTQLQKHSTQACDQNLGCLTKDDALAEGYFSTFAARVQAITMPPAAASSATAVTTDANQASQDFGQLSAVSNLGEYQTIYSDTGLHQDLDTFDHDASKLATALRGS